MSVEAQRVKEDFERSAQSYTLSAHVQRNILRQLVDLLAPRIPAQAQILDIGCGPGWIRSILDDYKPGADITGVDIAQAMCKQALTHQVKAVCASAESLPFASDHFDVVVSSLCAQWLPNPRHFIDEIARTLKPGGVAAMATLGPKTLIELRDAFALFGEESRVMAFRKEETWKAMAEGAGMDVIHMHSSIWRYPYASVAALLRSLRGAGATNKRDDRSRGLSGVELFAKVESAYEADYSRATGGVWASWQPLILLFVKPHA